MSGIGIVHNPLDSGNRRHPGLRDHLARLLGDDGELLDAGDPEALAGAVERLRAADVDTVAVSGGDQTTRQVLTALAPAWGGRRLPRLLLLGGGALDTLAANHGLAGPPDRILDEVLRRRRAGLPCPVTDRDLLRVEADGAAPALGFLFGTGLVVTFQERWDAAPRPSALSATLLLARAVASTLTGRGFARQLARRQALRVVADGEEWPDASYLALLAGTLPSVGLGFRALARAEEQPGSFQAVGVIGTLGAVARLLPRLHRGAPWRRRVALDAVAREVRLEGDGVRWSLDGDRLGTARSLRLSTGPAVEVLGAARHALPAV